MLRALILQLIYTLEIIHYNFLYDFFKIFKTRFKNTLLNFIIKFFLSNIHIVRKYIYSIVRMQFSAFRKKTSR